jgi:chemotaxis signal transduction protein
MELVLLFTLGEERYGLEVDLIQEVFEAPEVHFVPRATGALIGAINFHGQVLSIVDLPALLGLNASSDTSRLVVLTPAARSLALRVGRVERIVRVELTSVEPPPSGTATCAVRAVAEVEGERVYLLDTDEVVNQLENTYAA